MSNFLEFVRFVVNGDMGKVSHLLRSTHALATMALPDDVGVKPTPDQQSEPDRR